MFTQTLQIVWFVNVVHKDTNIGKHQHNRMETERKVWRFGCCSKLPMCKWHHSIHMVSHISNGIGECTVNYGNTTPSRTTIARPKVTKVSKTAESRRQTMTMSWWWWHTSGALVCGATTCFYIYDMKRSAIQATHVRTQRTIALFHLNDSTQWQCAQL